MPAAYKQRPAGRIAKPGLHPDSFGNLDRPPELPATGQRGYRSDTGDAPAPAIICRWTFIRA